jgi:alpha-amylase
MLDCVICGADGFRFDTAKHIALPDDGVPEAYAGQEDRNTFYPNMKEYMDEYASKDYADLFVYGEVLQGDSDRLDAYQEMLGGTTASAYGEALRIAVSSGNIGTKKLSGYKIPENGSADKLVTWVESHDNYINDKSYKQLDDEDVILGWAIIAARAEGTPLFFSRPMGSSKDNPWGDNVIGEAGSDLYKAPEVVAVNKFRTKMEGLDENLVNPSNNNSVLMIERGDKGAVIINASDKDFELEESSKLMEGTYVDSVEGHEGIFYVGNGLITGVVPAGSVVVLDEVSPATKTPYASVGFIVMLIIFLTLMIVLEIKRRKVVKKIAG